MPRKVIRTTRSFEQIFQQSQDIGPENIFVNDAEIGIVLAGGAEPRNASTIANMRYRGELDTPIVRGADREPLSRLSDVLDYRDRKGAA